MGKTLRTISFYFRNSVFNFREQFVDLPSALAANALIPFFVWLLSQVWLKFNSEQKNFTLPEVIIYIGLTELLFMTFVRSNSVSRASGDFSISLARPRSWLMFSFTGIIGRALGSRLIMLIILAVTFPVLGVSLLDAGEATGRLLLVLPWLTVLQGLFALFFASAQVLWHQTDYFLMPFGKIFLVLGGVWGPLSDFSDPWRSWLLLLPPSDLFFQPIFFCLRGEFYEMSALTWLARTGLLALTLIGINILFFKTAKTRHLSYGG